MHSCMFYFTDGRRSELARLKIGKFWNGRGFINGESTNFVAMAEFDAR